MRNEALRLFNKCLGICTISRNVLKDDNFLRNKREVGLDFIGINMKKKF